MKRIYICRSINRVVYFIMLIISLNNRKIGCFRQITSFFTVLIFLFSLVIPVPMVQAKGVFNLPDLGNMVSISPVYSPIVLKGFTISPGNLFEFEFIVDVGDDRIENEILEAEASNLIKYFMASLTTPEDQMWVNLSPYEKDRIIPSEFGKTEMGRDLLAQDYILKQLTASLIHPNEDLGGAFWKRVYAKSEAMYGITEIPMNTFNKVWIVPDRASVYVKDLSVFVIESRLKVLLEEDYLALENNINSVRHDLGDVRQDDLTKISKLSLEVMKELILPEIEREVNEGKNFVKLRQIYNSVILATWFKKNLNESFLGKVYVDQNKTDGIALDDNEINKRIYAQYVEAFEKGVYNFIKEDYDEVTQQVIPRKYFSGGVNLNPQVYNEDTAVLKDPFLSPKLRSVKTVLIPKQRRKQPLGSPAGVFVYLLEHGSQTREQIAKGLGVSVRTIDPDISNLNRWKLLYRPDGVGKDKAYGLNEDTKQIALGVVSILETLTLARPKANEQAEIGMQLDNLRASKKKTGVGLVFGKFAPFHKGHEIVVREALRNSEKVILLLYEHTELIDIPADAMADLIRRVIDDDRLEVRVARYSPPAGHTLEDKKAHNKYMKSQIPQGIKINKVFNNELYGKDIADYLGAQLIRVDPERESQPISATEIRENPEAHKDFMHPIIYNQVIVAKMHAPGLQKSFFEGVVDTKEMAFGLPASKIDKVRQRLRNRNLGYDEKKLLGTPTWDIKKFKKKNGPSVIGKLIDKKGFSKQRGLRILDMPFLMKGQGLMVPKGLEPFMEAIKMAIETEISINPDFSIEDWNGYITVDQKTVPPEKTQRRYGPHSDAYVTNENTVMDKEILTTNTYVFYDKLPTDYFDGPFSLEGVDPQNDVEVLNKFKEHATKQTVVHYPSYTGLRMTPYDIHTPAVNNTDKPIRRTFVKITFSKDRYNLLGNQINTFFDYSDWTWATRDPERNHRNRIFDEDRQDENDFRLVNAAEIDFSKDTSDVDWVESKMIWAKKTGDVEAELAKSDEIIETKGKNGFVSTYSIAQRGAWKVNNQYFLGDQRFRDRYNNETEQGRYVPTQWPTKMVKIKETVRFKAPWGSMQYAPAGSMLAFLGKDDIYAILPDDFKKRYTVTDPFGNKSGVKVVAQPNPFLGKVEKAVVSTQRPSEEDLKQYRSVYVNDVNFLQNTSDSSWTKDYFIWAKKVEGVYADKATPGEVLETRVHGIVMTTNTAKIGDWKITTSQGDQYFLGDKQFRGRYNNEVDKNGLYIPTGWPSKMVEITESIKFIGPWGEMQYVPAGSYLVYLNKNDIYAVSRDNFVDSYQRTDKRGTVLMDSKFIEKQITVADQNALRTKLEDLNPGYDRKKLLEVLHCDISEFDNQHLPVVVGKVKTSANINKPRGIRTLDILLYAPGQGWRIPAYLKHLADPIRQAFEAEFLINPDVSRRFVHLTFDQKWIEPDDYGRRAGLHTDFMLQNDEGNQIDVTAQNKAYIAEKKGPSNHAYIFHSIFPTRFYPGPFRLKSLEDQRSFENVVEEEGQEYVTYPNNTMLRLAYTDVHGAVRNDDKHEPKYRTFFKLQFTEEMLDREINTINPAFDYDRARNYGKITKKEWSILSSTDYTPEKLIQILEEVTAY